MIKIKMIYVCNILIKIKSLLPNEMLREKAQWEQQKTAMCCFEQILEVATL